MLVSNITQIQIEQKRGNSVRKPSPSKKKKHIAAAKKTNISDNQVPQKKIMRTIHDASKHYKGAPTKPLVHVVKHKLEHAPSTAHEQKLAEQTLTHVQEVCGSEEATAKYRRWSVHTCTHVYKEHPAQRCKHKFTP